MPSKALCNFGIKCTNHFNSLTIHPLILLPSHPPTHSPPVSSTHSFSSRLIHPPILLPSHPPTHSPPVSSTHPFSCRLIHPSHQPTHSTPVNNNKSSKNTNRNLQSVVLTTTQLVSHRSLQTICCPPYRPIDRVAERMTPRSGDLATKARTFFQ